MGSQKGAKIEIDGEGRKESGGSDCLRGGIGSLGFGIWERAVVDRFACILAYPSPPVLQFNLKVLTFLKPSKKKTFRKRVHEEDEEDVDSKSGSASLSSRRNSPKLDDGILVLSGCSLDPDLCMKLHDGGDDKSQWLIDWREFEKQRKTNGLLGEHGVDQTKKNRDDYYDSLPVVCCICKQHFCDPVVTTCKHYFCSDCALEQYSKNKKCFVCDEPTANIFKTAQEICIKMSANGK
ncbi:hypothetical protein M0R45_001318 [Rubus argutus]|uniref:RING-type domain-containing protein n=1 Tax=Rubus argutus TaxID=59490 RepID=A0AAW1VJA8_RUBAR